ncbi:DeoR/GlpR family DNA-binding transcription regulator [Rhodobacteraceae bacterium 10Alg 79]|uniref:DeoR/GlpR family DNA-binding transcription regulator n=1 Tax=Rhodalgimonas zhirmunskyi TaxID=2964767 RepID=A0AAJ1X4Q8_9RHOB|nr:DeoR/GlpR family DNA-binding transcription regulator [Rhodoalgimonas zhirmunskyi]
MQRVHGDGRATIDALAQQYRVSPQTIRRDVNALCAAGQLRRVHGGVETPRSSNILYTSRRRLNEGAKQNIAHCFAKLIPSGASLAVSIGTTPEIAVQSLETQVDLMVLTNNLNIALYGCDREGWGVQIPGGTLRAGDQDILGPQVEAFFRRYQADFGVFGVGGVSEDGTLLDFTEEEVAVRMAIQRNCRCSILLLDHSKFGRAAHVRGGRIEDVDYVISDMPVPAACAEALGERGVEMIIAEDAK